MLRAQVVGNNETTDIVDCHLSSRFTVSLRADLSYVATSPRVLNFRWAELRWAIVFRLGERKKRLFRGTKK